MKFLRETLKEIGVFLKQCWFLVLLLLVALLAYPSVRSSEFWVWASLSYVTSFVFYVLTIYLPQRRNQKTMHRVILPYLHSIINDVKNVFYTFLAASREKCDQAHVTEGDIEKVFRIINPQDKSTRLEFLGFVSWFQYLENQKNRVRRATDRILTHEHFLETDFIHLVESLHNSALFEILDVAEKQAASHENFTFLADAYAESFRQVQQMEVFLKKYQEGV